MSDTSVDQLGGRYRLVSERESYPFGELWEAEDNQGARTLVLRFHAEVEDPRAKVAAALDESASVDSVQVVPWSDGGVDGGRGWVAAPLFGPWSLREHIARNEGLTALDAAPVLHQVARTLAAGERAGVMHLCLASELVRLVPIPEGGYAVKLYGYGLGQILPPYKPLRRNAAFVGVPDYMSPELCAGKPADGQVDVYAVGTLMYEAIRGRPPFAPTFASASASTTLKRQMYEKPLALSVRYGAMPHIKAYDAIAMKALSKTAPKRQASMAGFEEELAALVVAEMKLALVPLASASSRPATTSRRLRTQVLPSIPAGAEHEIPKETANASLGTVETVAEEAEPEAVAQVAAAEPEAAPADTRDRRRKPDATLVFAGLGPAVRDLARPASEPEDEAVAEAPTPEPEPEPEPTPEATAPAAEEAPAVEEAPAAEEAPATAEPEPTPEPEPKAAPSEPARDAFANRATVQVAAVAGLAAPASAEITQAVAAMADDGDDDEDEEETAGASAGSQQPQRRKGKKRNKKRTGASKRPDTGTRPEFEAVPLHRQSATMVDAHAVVPQVAEKAQAERVDRAKGDRPTSEEKALPASAGLAAAKPARVRRDEHQTVIEMEGIPASARPTGTDEQEDWFVSAGAPMSDLASEQSSFVVEKKPPYFWYAAIAVVAVVLVAIYLLTQSSGGNAEPAKPRPEESLQGAAGAAPTLPAAAGPSEADLAAEKDKREALRSAVGDAATRPPGEVTPPEAAAKAAEEVAAAKAAEEAAAAKAAEEAVAAKAAEEAAAAKAAEAAAAARVAEEAAAAKAAEEAAAAKAAASQSAGAKAAADKAAADAAKKAAADKAAADAAKKAAADKAAADAAKKAAADKAAADAAKKAAADRGTTDAAKKAAADKAAADAAKKAAADKAAADKAAADKTAGTATEDSFKEQSQHYIKLGLEAYKKENYKLAAGYFDKAHDLDSDNKLAERYLKLAREKMNP